MPPNRVIGYLRDGCPNVFEASVTYWSGHATPEATEAYFAGALAAHRVSRDARTELTLSRLGINASGLDESLAAHHEAVRLAITSGCNVICVTASDDMRANSATMCDALQEAFESQTLRREAILTICRVGHMSAASVASTSFPLEHAEILRWNNDHWHCIHPAWLSIQLQRLRQLLKLSTLDVCLLDTPELHLRETRGADDATGLLALDELRDRLRRAFSFLEDEVHAGRLCYYGLSSARVALDVPQAYELTVAEALNIAHDIAGDQHQLRFVEVPLNIIESDAATVRHSCLDGCTLLDFAQSRGLCVLTRRPLDARGFGSVRLVSLPPSRGSRKLPSLLRRAAQIDKTLAYSEIAPILSSTGANISRLATASTRVAELAATVPGPRAWNRLVHALLSDLAADLRIVDRTLPAHLSDAWLAWRRQHTEAIDALVAAFTDTAIDRSRPLVHALEAGLSTTLPPSLVAASLEQKALAVAMSTPHVSSVLLRMRSVAHVTDALRVATWRSLNDTGSVYNGIRRLRLHDNWRAIQRLS